MSTAVDSSGAGWIWALGFLQGLVAGVALTGLFLVREWRLRKRTSPQGPLVASGALAHLPQVDGTGSAVTDFERAAAEEARAARRRALTAGR